jgi:hypothetical protein
MSEGHSDRSDQIWLRVRRVILEVVHEILGPVVAQAICRINCPAKMSY